MFFEIFYVRNKGIFIKKKKKEKNVEWKAQYKWKQYVYNVPNMESLTAFIQALSTKNLSKTFY